MARRVEVISFILVFICLLWQVLGQDSDPKNVPQGMEIIEIGQTKVIVPKGSKIDKRGGLVLLENVDEYSAERLMIFKSA